jgi:1-acyl-sn-glycerol-3-phosphate acyltransferase
MAPYLAQLLVDPYHAVRFIAYRSLRRLPRFGDFQYDFMGTPVHRDKLRRRAFGIWAQRGSAVERGHRDALLIGTDGGLRTDRFNRLLRQRDDRFIYLAE